MTAVWRTERLTARAPRRPGRSKRPLAWTCLACVASLTQPGTGRALNPGLQDVARAASQGIVLAVQQGISALPPTSGQSLVYEFDPRTDVFVRSERLGPTSLRAPETIGEGVFSLRAATSYFALATTLGPIVYSIEPDDPDVSPTVYTKFGSEIDAKVGVFNFTLDYGITRNIEASLNLPIVVVDAQDSLVYTANSRGFLGFRDSIPKLNDALASHVLGLRTLPLSESDGFNAGTHAGVGRISLGAKALVYFKDPFGLAAACDFYFPSPSQAEFAGSDSPAILPRLIGAARLTDWARLLLDVGYDYDFDVSQLRRFVWDVGVSFPLALGTFDLGMGGSTYDTPIAWIPGRARVPIFPGDPPDATVTAIGDNETGTNYVSFLAGAKVGLSDAVVLSGAVNVPVTDPGLQPIVGGTIALEVYF